MVSGGMRADIVQVLAEDPDLAASLPEDELPRAQELLVARGETLPPDRQNGPWGPPDTRGWIGLMIVEGLAVREIAIGKTAFAELLGPHDLIRPWDHDGGVGLPVEATVEWEILEETRVALLDDAFAARAAAWPPVLAGLSTRGVRRAHSLAIHQAICQLGRVEERLVLLFWHLAQRWGRVRADGVLVTVPLTHAMLAKLIGARRPSVTTALGALRKRGKLERTDDGWLIPQENDEPVPVRRRRASSASR